VKPRPKNQVRPLNCNQRRPSDDWTDVRARATTPRAPRADCQAEFAAGNALNRPHMESLRKWFYKPKASTRSPRPRSAAESAPNHSVPVARRPADLCARTQGAPRRDLKRTRTLIAARVTLGLYINWLFCIFRSRHTPGVPQRSAGWLVQFCECAHVIPVQLHCRAWNCRSASRISLSRTQDLRKLSKTTHLSNSTVLILEKLLLFGPAMCGFFHLRAVMVCERKGAIVFQRDLHDQYLWRREREKHTPSSRNCLCCCLVRAGCRVFDFREAVCSVSSKNPRTPVTISTYNIYNLVSERTRGLIISLSSADCFYRLLTAD
jgi:hypothetical protein